MTKKEARQECRNLAIKHNTGWWSLCWTKQNGYYPANTYHKGIENNHICWVHKDGRYMYATKKNAKRHQLKGNVLFPH